jgi:hypothetical protein
VGSVADEGSHFGWRSGFLVMRVECLEIVDRLGLLLPVIWLVLYLLTHYC